MAKFNLHIVTHLYYCTGEFALWNNFVNFASINTAHSPTYTIYVYEPFVI